MKKVFVVSVSPYPNYGSGVVKESITASNLVMAAKEAASIWNKRNDAKSKRKVAGINITVAKPLG